MGLSPILHFSADKTNQFTGKFAGTCKFVGTGFFIGMGGLLATAKHNIDKADFRLNDLAEWGAALYFYENSRPPFDFRRIIASQLHGESDLAIAVTQPAETPFSGPIKTFTPRHFTRHFAMTTRIPPVGSEVVMCAFPKTSVVNTDDGGFSFSVVPSFYKGRITEYMPEGRPGLRGPCFQTSILAHFGASGGPVFDERGRVFGVISKGWDLQADEEPWSFVSSILPLFDLTIPLPAMPQRGERPRRITVRELARIGDATIED